VTAVDALGAVFFASGGQFFGDQLKQDGVVFFNPVEVFFVDYALSNQAKTLDNLK